MYGRSGRHGDDEQHDVEYRSGMFIRCDADHSNKSVKLYMGGAFTSGFCAKNRLRIQRRGCYNSNCRVLYCCCTVNRNDKWYGLGRSCYCV